MITTPPPYASRTRVHLTVLKRRKEKNKMPTTGRRHSSPVMNTIPIYDRKALFFGVYIVYFLKVVHEGDECIIDQLRGQHIYAMIYLGIPDNCVGLSRRLGYSRECNKTRFDIQPKL